MWSKHLNVSISVHEFLEPRNIAVLWRGIHLETRPAERTFVYAIQQTAGVGHFRVVRQRRVHAHAQEFLSAIDVRIVVQLSLLFDFGSGFIPFTYIAGLSMFLEHSSRMRAYAVFAVTNTCISSLVDANC